MRYCRSNVCVSVCVCLHNVEFQRKGKNSQYYKQSSLNYNKSVMASSHSINTVSNIFALIDLNGLWKVSISQHTRRNNWPKIKNQTCPRWWNLNPNCCITLAKVFEAVAWFKPATIKYTTELFYLLQRKLRLFLLL